MSDQLQTPPAEPTPSDPPSPSPTPTPTPEPTPQPEPKPPIASAAPEKYADFTLPEGMKLEGESLTKAHELFKGLNLTQEGAQSLVDFHTAELGRITQAVQEAGEDSFRQTVEGWGAQLKADPEIGSNLAQVKANLGKAYDVLINAVPEKAAETRALITEFKTMMDLTGAGNHPAFVKVFNRLAQRVIEPGHVAGRNPAGVGADGKLANGNPGIAASMYPNNP